MSDSYKPAEWTAQQWSTVQQAVYEEARKARVAARFLPLYGPLAADAETVPTELLEPEPSSPGAHEPARLHVNDTSVLRITTIAVNVYLNAQQVAQPDLSAALTLLRRAANIIARVEDMLIFRGGSDAVIDGLKKQMGDVFRLSGGISKKGLYDYAVEHPQPDPIPDGDADDVLKAIPDGDATALLSAISRGITTLEDHGYVGPYALALGNKLFVTSETPSPGSLVLPSDRIRPLIEGPLVRTGTLPALTGVLLSLAGKPVEIVVAQEIHATFLQVSAEPRWIYRVSERFVLRVKEPKSIVAIVLPPPKGK